MTYTGYVYIWYDTTLKWFYIGGHHGRVDDSYRCSSRAMLRAYCLRPETFRFRVLEYVDGDTTTLRLAEKRWLDMVKDHELLLSQNVKSGTCRYYNVKKHSAGGNGKGTNRGKPNGGGHNKGKKLINGVFHSCDGASPKESPTLKRQYVRKTSEQFQVPKRVGRLDHIVTARKKSKRPTPRPKRERKRKSSDTLTEKQTPRIARKHTEQSKKKLSDAAKGRVTSEETRRKLSELGTGRRHSEISKRKMSEAKRCSMTLETRKKISESLSGKPKVRSEALIKEQAQRCADLNRKRIWTPEMRQKMSESAKASRKRRDQG